jgi:hypothetical protein
MPPPRPTNPPLQKATISASSHPTITASSSRSSPPPTTQPRSPSSYLTYPPLSTATVITQLQRPTKASSSRTNASHSARSTIPSSLATNPPKKPTVITGTQRANLPPSTQLSQRQSPPTSPRVIITQPSYSAPNISLQRGHSSPIRLESPHHYSRDTTPVVCPNPQTNTTTQPQKPQSLRHQASQSPPGHGQHSSSAGKAASRGNRHGSERRTRVTSTPISPTTTSTSSTYLQSDDGVSAPRLSGTINRRPTISESPSLRERSQDASASPSPSRQEELRRARDGKHRAVSFVFDLLPSLNYCPLTLLSHRVPTKAKMLIICRANLHVDGPAVLDELRAMHHMLT